MSDVYRAPQAATSAGLATAPVSDAYDADAGSGLLALYGLIAHGGRRAAA